MTDSKEKARRSKLTFWISPKYKVERVLGEGSYGLVARAWYIPTDIPVAIKKINAFTNATMCLRTLRELMLLKRFRDHENIITLYNVQIPESFEKFNEVYLIEEFMDTDLHHLIKNKSISDSHSEYFTYQILRGLKALHLANVIHRDLKPSNILVNNNCDVKICDLGLSRLDTSCKTGEISNLTEYVATRWYRAPEIMLSACNYSKSMDLWSVGCILAELLTGHALFPGKDYCDQLLLIFQILGNPINYVDDYASIKSRRARKYISTFPNYRRVDLELFLQHHPNRVLRYGDRPIDPYAVDLLGKLLCFNPDSRLTVEEAISHPFLQLYHDPGDEPTISPIPEEEFEFDNRKGELSIQELKLKMYDTVINFHR